MRRRHHQPEQKAPDTSESGDSGGCGGRLPSPVQLRFPQAPAPVPRPTPVRHSVAALKLDWSPCRACRSPTVVSRGRQVRVYRDDAEWPGLCRTQNGSPHGFVLTLANQHRCQRQRCIVHARHMVGMTGLSQAPGLKGMPGQSSAGVHRYAHVCLRLTGHKAL